MVKKNDLQHKSGVKGCCGEFGLPGQVWANLGQESSLGRPLRANTCAKLAPLQKKSTSMKRSCLEGLVSGGATFFLLGQVRGKIGASLGQVF